MSAQHVHSVIIKKVLADGGRQQDYIDTPSAAERLRVLGILTQPASFGDAGNIVRGAIGGRDETTGVHCMINEKRVSR